MWKNKPQDNGLESIAMRVGETIAFTKNQEEFVGSPDEKRIEREKDEVVKECTWKKNAKEMEKAKILEAKA